MNRDEQKLLLLKVIVAGSIILGIKSMLVSSGKDPNDERIQQHAAQMKIDENYCIDSTLTLYPDKQLVPTSTQTQSAGVHVVFKGPNNWHASCMTTFDHRIYIISIRRERGGH